VLAAGQAGFELVGPGEKVRPLNLATKQYDVLSLQQFQVGSRVVFSLVADRPQTGNMEEERPLFAGVLQPRTASGKVTALGEIPLPDKLLSLVRRGQQDRGAAQGGRRREGDCDLLTVVSFRR